MGKRFVAAGAAGAAGMLCLLLLVLGVLPGISTASDDPEPPKNPGPNEQVCGEKVHFFAADVDANFFGPSAEDKVGQLRQELHRRRCVDPALVVAHAYTWGLTGFNELSGDAAFVAKTRELRDNPKLWRATVTELERVEAEATASIETMQGSYQTLYMLDGVEDVPLIRKAAPDKPAFKVLRFVRGDKTVNLKLDCGFQPVAQDFPGVPPVKEAPPTPTAPPTTVKVCPPEMPHGKWPVCKDDPSRDPEQQGNNRPGGGGVEEGGSVEGGPKEPASRPPKKYTPPKKPKAEPKPADKPSSTPSTTAPPSPPTTAVPDDDPEIELPDVTDNPGGF